MIDSDVVMLEYDYNYRGISKYVNIFRITSKELMEGYDIDMDLDLFEDFLLSKLDLSFLLYFKDNVFAVAITEYHNFISDIKNMDKTLSLNLYYEPVTDIGVAFRYYDERTTVVDGASEYLLKELI